MAISRLQRLLKLLAAAHRGAHAPLSDPWHAILHENVAYLCDDDAQQRAFDVLRRTTKLDAAAIAGADDDELLAATLHGKMARQRADKLRECAQLAATVGDPRELVKLPLPKARAALKRFPGIGDPGADRLLLFAGAAPAIALESNGLRTLLRLGYGTERSSYAQSYRSARDAAAAELPETLAARRSLFVVMRAQGREVCRATPACASCVVAAECPSRRPAVRPQQAGGRGSRGR